MRFGVCCVGSSIGLMAMLVALGVMSLTWMVVIAVLVVAQKLLPAKAAVDMPLALAIVGFGIWIAVAPSSVPGARAADLRCHRRRHGPVRCDREKSRCDRKKKGETRQ